MSPKHLLTATLLATPFALAGTAAAQPITGLYIGAGVGANFMEQQQFRTVLSGPPPVTTAFGKQSFKNGFVGLGSVGWGFGNGLRLEAEGNYRENDADRGGSGRREEKYGGMVNALFDLDIGSPYVYPYIGAGVGFAEVHRRLDSTLLLGSGSDNAKTSFAYQAIAGLSFPIPWVVGLSLTAEYRYYALSGDRSYSA